MERVIRGLVAAELSRRDFLQRTSTLGAAALVASALPLAERLTAGIAYAADPSLDDAMLQAFADTIIPGRKVAKTDLGDPIHPQAIAGVDADPGAVEADSLRLFHDSLIGFDALEPAFLTDLSTRALPLGGDFLSLPYDKRVQAVMAGFDFANPTRLLYEAATAVPFTAFCAAAVHPFGNNTNASGYKVMGYPGGGPNDAPVMYPYSFSYRRKLGKERTKKGYLA
ncbi:MAG: hypothetical protein QOJ29_5301 [Thermoleophilaceae bacterium]|jgi:hypothetical protein|nr:hypothetical protein [Thermoleophilaceae bacterium]